MISIIVATYGNRQVWDQIARPAMLSAVNETDDLIRVHGKTLHEARNEGAAKARHERIMFLDADDKIRQGFVRQVVQKETILQPKTMFVSGLTVEYPSWIKPFPSIYDGNHLIVGCPVLKEAFMDVGGFDDYPIYEDWALWLKMIKAGATVGKTNGVYIVNKGLDGRNAQNPGDWIERIRKDFS